MDRKVSNGNGVPSYLTETQIKGQINWAYQHDSATLESDSDTDTYCEIEDVVSGNEEKGLRTHSIVLDLSTTSFVDTVTVKTMTNVSLDCQTLLDSLQYDVSLGQYV